MEMLLAGNFNREAKLSGFRGNRVSQAMVAPLVNLGAAGLSVLLLTIYKVRYFCGGSLFDFGFNDFTNMDQVW